MAEDKYAGSWMSYASKIGSKLRLLFVDLLMEDRLKNFPYRGQLEDILDEIFSQFSIGKKSGSCHGILSSRAPPPGAPPPEGGVPPKAGDPPAHRDLPSHPLIMTTRFACLVY